MRISNVLSQLAEVLDTLPLDLSLGRLTLHCLDGSFLVIDQDMPSSDLTDLEIKFLLFGIQIETRTMLQIYISKYLQN